MFLASIQGPRAGSDDDFDLGQANAVRVPQLAGALMVSRMKDGLQSADSRRFDARVARPGEGLKVAPVQCDQRLGAGLTGGCEVQPVMDRAAAHAA